MLGTRAAAAGLFASLGFVAAIAQATGELPALDGPVRPIARIDWVDPLNPAYVNLGQELFLFDTKQGVKTWDFATRALADPQLDATAGLARIGHLDAGVMNWARLGSAGPAQAPGMAGTIFIGLRGEQRSGDLLWWNPATRSIAATLPLPGEVEVSHRLLALGDGSALLCRWKQDAAVVQLVRQDGAFRLQWARAGDPAVRAALQAAGVVGAVQGFGTLPAVGAAPARGPVLFDTAFCGWDLVDPPAWLAEHLDPRTRSQPPAIKPYFLDNGGVLVPELEYFHAQSRRWVRSQSALIRPRGAAEWTQLRSNRGEGNETHRVGQEEPVLATGSDSDLIEFFDPPTLGWRRSVERLPRGVSHVMAEPLRPGRALVLLRETAEPFRGMVTVMSAASGELRPERLVDPHVGYFGEVALPGHRLLLFGAGTHWNPRDAVQRIDMASRLAGAVAPFPALARIPVAPSGIVLADGSVLVFGGLPPRCAPGYFAFATDACADLGGLPSLRYWPKDDRWDLLPQLAIPFSRGPHWQTGNSERVAQWPRADVAVRRSGELVWVHAADVPARQEHDLRPRASPLMAWSPAQPDRPPRERARLRKGRTGATLLELDDGRLAVIGGFAQLETVALEKDCLDCPDEFVSIGPFQAARSTEVLDETDPARPLWKPGPLAHFAGGKAFRLPGGRIFKLSLSSWDDGDGYQAEVADAAFTAWSRLPPMPRSATSPLPRNPDTQVVVMNVGVVGQRVLLLTNRGITIVWDDAKREWRVWPGWPGRRGSVDALSVHPAPGEGEAFVRWRDDFAVVPLPRD